MATHSSILAGTVPWSEESGGLQSIRSQRVGYNLTYDTWENKYLDHSFGRRGTLVSCGRFLARSLLYQPDNLSSSPCICPLCLLPAPVLTEIHFSSVPSAEPAVWSRSLMLCVPQFTVSTFLVAGQKKYVLLPSCKRRQHLCAAACPWRQKKPAKPEISLFQDMSLPWWSPEWVRWRTPAWGLFVELRGDWFGGHSSYRNTEQLDHWVTAGNSLVQSCLAHVWDSVSPELQATWAGFCPWDHLPTILYTYPVYTQVLASSVWTVVWNTLGSTAFGSDCWKVLAQGSDTPLFLCPKGQIRCWVHSVYFLIGWVEK